jgi:hypothetical protein
VEREEIKYRLQKAEWWEDRQGNFHRLLHDRETRVKFHKGGFCTVEYHSRFKQWVIVAQEYDRHVRQHGRNLVIGDFNIPLR